ncbi:MAG: CotH kinase family protein [Kineosporiaceae bacterium]
MTPQKLCDQFYDLATVLTIRVTMAAHDWAALKHAEPHGGRCNFGFVGERYDWFEAAQVEISGSVFPAGGPHRFAQVGISKKSYCGSFSTTKPSLRLNFSRFLDTNEAAMEALVGTRYVTLHNCVQDPSYIRQPLGYDLFKQAGLPYSRSNYAHVYVNDAYQGLYLNCEPVKKRHVQNTFANDQGNLYEIECGEDLTVAMVDSGRIPSDGFSDVRDGADLRLAAQRIAEAGLAGAAEVIDLAQFTRFYAMETLLKHWDGYTGQVNNAYVYNDVVAVANPTIDTVNLRFIPWGLDQILQEQTRFNLDDDSILGSLIRNDPAALESVRAEIRALLGSVFSRANYDLRLNPLIDRLKQTLITAGVTTAAADVEAVRRQVRLVRSGGYQLAGHPQESVSFLARGSDECLHASAGETVGPHQEVYHHPLSASPSDRWFIRPAGADGDTLVNDQFGTHLHGDATTRTLGGNLNVYAVRFHPSDGNVYSLTPVDADSPFKVSGYLTLRGRGAASSVHFSETDLTAAGQKQVHQSPPNQATVLQIY